MVNKADSRDLKKGFDCLEDLVRSPELSHGVLMQVFSKAQAVKLQKLIM